MQRIAGMTVKASGSGFEAVYNGQRDRVVEAIREEMERQKEALNAEMDSMREELTGEIAMERDRADINQRARSRMLRDRLNSLKKALYSRRSPVRRMLRAAGNAYALTVGTIMCLPEIGETLGLWEIIREEDEHEEYERAAFADRRKRSKEPRR